MRPTVKAVSQRPCKTSQVLLNKGDDIFVRELCSRFDRSPWIDSRRFLNAETLPHNSAYGGLKENTAI